MALKRAFVVSWIAAACIAAALALAGARPGSIDDAFILLVYVRRFAGGGGLRYNVEDAPVDGFTSLLDLLLKAAVYPLTGGDGVRAAWIVSTVLYFAVVGAGAALAVRVLRGRGWAPVAGLALALCPGLAYGTSFLLDTPLYGLTIVVAVLALVYRARPGVLGGLAAFALVLARPEGWLLAPLLLGAALWLGGREGWRSPAVFLGLAAAFCVWRVQTFGHVLPNTYFAKTSSHRWNEVRDGLAYLDAFTRGVGAERPLGQSLVGGTLLLQVVIGPLLAWGGAWSDPRSRARYLALSVVALCVLAGVVGSGGDAYPGARFLVPPFLLGLAAATEAAAGITSRERMIPRAVLAVVAFGGLALVLPRAGQKLRSVVAAPPGDADFACSRTIAERIASVVPGARLAQHDFQRFKYFADDTYVMDTTGLNHARIAHEPEAGRVRFGRDGILHAVRDRYEIIHVDYLWSRPDAMAHFGIREIFGDARVAARFHGAPLVREEVGSAMQGEYVPATLEDACGPGNFNLFVRSDLAPAFRAAAFLVGQ
ncbi:MAG: hypothetical protein GY711_12805 [bacterium]|nr:hypothetical protein [bacterium]